MLLNESGIRLPKNIKSAKIITHTDEDGFISALLLYNQLIRQGVPAERINIKFAQYGDYDLLDKATRKNKTQALLSCDFSAFPKVDMEASYNGFAKTYNEKDDKFEYPKKGYEYKDFKNRYISKQPSFKLISTFLRTYNPNALLFTKPKDSSVIKSLNDFIEGWKKYKGDDNVIVTDLDYTSDHHSNEKGDLVPGKSGKIGAEYRSDAEHIFTVAAQNLMNWDDIEAVSKVDSATYSNLKDTIFMPSPLKSKDRKERLAILVSSLVNGLIKNNPRLAELLIKRCQPSLVSIYNNALKVAKLNDNELEILSELKKEDPDWNKIDELSKDLPGYEKKKLLRTSKENQNIKPVPSIQQIRDKTQKNIEREKLVDKTDFNFYGNIAVFQAKNMKDQPSRYLFAFLNHEGKQPAFVIKKMPGIGMVQVAASPLLKESDKAKIDLEPICKEAIDSAVENGVISSFAKDIILQKSGGHKTIYNISNLGIIGNTALPPSKRYELKSLKDYEARRKNLYKNATSEYVKSEAKKLEKRNKLVDELSSQKTEATSKAIEYLSDYIIKKLKSEYGNLEARSDFKINME